MLDAIFSIGTFIVKKVVDFAVKTVKAVVREVIRDFVGDITGNTQTQQFRSSTTTSTAHLNSIRDLDEEVTDLERKQRHDGVLSSKDRDRLKELEQCRSEESKKYRDAKQREILVQARDTNTDYVAPLLTDSKVHVLQYHMGQVVLEKRCPLCGFPMVLQHKSIDEPSFSDFFWSCTRFYQLKLGEKRCPAMSFRPYDISLLHQEGIPELEADREDIELIFSEDFVQAEFQRRLETHRGQQDADILCPIHMLPMKFWKKKQHNGHILDMFILMCPHEGCTQTVKLKSAAQIAAYLRRQEGVGIL